MTLNENNRTDDDYRPAPGEAEVEYVDNVANVLAPYWSLYMFRGVIVTLFGLFFLLNPAGSIDVIAKVFGSLLVIEGIIHLVKVFMYRNTTPTMTFTSITTDNITYFSTQTDTHGSTLLCVHGISCAINIIIGILIFTHPMETAGFLMVFAAVWFILIGLLQLLLARAYHLAGEGYDYIMVLVGLCYVILGTFFLFHLGQGAQTLIMVMGLVVTLFGIQLLYVAMKLREKLGVLIQQEPQGTTTTSNEQQQPLHGAPNTTTTTDV